MNLNTIQGLKSQSVSFKSNEQNNRNKFSLNLDRAKVAEFKDKSDRFLKKAFSTDDKVKIVVNSAALGGALGAASGAVFGVLGSLTPKRILGIIGRTVGNGFVAGIIGVVTGLLAGGVISCK